MHGSSPDPFVKSAVVICGSAKTSGHNVAFLEGPIAALESSVDYAGGAYKANHVHPVIGLRAFGRAYVAWLTSAEWFRQELWKKLGMATLEDWIAPKVGRYESGWDAEDLLTLARMWQAGDIGTVAAGAGKGDWKKALEGVEARVLVMPSMTDQYFDWRDGEEEVKYLKRGVWAPIETVWGHMGGGGGNPVDTEWMDKRIARFLEGEEAKI